jgi:DNA-directed RNA polymerase subunit beta'
MQTLAGTPAAAAAVAVAAPEVVVESTDAEQAED